MKAALTYILAFAAVAAAVALAAEQLVKAGKKNQLPHVTNNALALAGGILAVLGGGFAVFAFTGTLGPLVIFASLISTVLGALYAWRRKRERATNEIWEALLAEEEQEARQTAERDPSNAAAWERLSELRVKRGDLPGALELFTKVCELEPTRRNADRLAELREAVRALPPPRPASNPENPN
ncbi:MAG: hypothetical protein PHV33_01440 [Elusimicrobiales bacterium]|nr:hypothetical protein [Elusimicrobiales bacterium]